MKTIRSVLFILILSGFFALRCGATIYQSDGSATSVQSLHNAALDGDTITIPTGTLTWSTPLTISKAITLTGTNSSNRPVITSSYSGGFGIQINSTANRTVTVKDIRFNNWMSSNALFLITGSGPNVFRLTNLEFTGTHRWSVWVSSLNGSGGEGPYGLIDHCTWPDGGSAIFVRDNPQYSPNSWHRAMSWGTIKAVYIEDCTFTATSSFPNYQVAHDGDNGARVVFRHNTLTNFGGGNHGADSSGPTNSALQFEVMHNTFTATNGIAQDFCFFTRGGSCVVFDNTLQATGNGTFNSLTKAQYFRATVGGGGVCTQDRFYPQDYLGTQQPGMGVNPGATSQDPHHPKQPWVSMPMYSWNNHITVSDASEMRVGGGGDAQFMQLNRDYFVATPKPGYIEFTYPHPLQSSPPTLSTIPSSPQNVQKEKKKWQKNKQEKGKKGKRAKEKSANEMSEGQEESTIKMAE